MISLWMTHIPPTNASHGVGCATDVSNIGTISGRWVEEVDFVASPFHNVSNTWSHRAMRPTTKSPAMTPNGRVQNEGKPSIGSNIEVERLGAALPAIEADLYRSSTPSLAYRRRDPRSLEPIVRVHLALAGVPRFRMKYPSPSKKATPTSRNINSETPNTREPASVPGETPPETPMLPSTWIATAAAAPHRPTTPMRM